MHVTVTLLHVDEPDANGCIFPESTLRDALHQLQGKPVYSARTGRRVGTIEEPRIVNAEGSQSVFTPGRRDASEAQQLVARIELEGTFRAPEELRGHLLWDGSLVDQRVTRARFPGVLLSRDK